MDSGPYAFGERVEARLQDWGQQLTLWIGITTIDGAEDLNRCLGILPRAFLEQLATEVLRRLRPTGSDPLADPLSTAHRKAAK